MPEPKNRKLEWMLTAIFGIGSVVFILVALAHFSNQGGEVVLERDDRDASNSSPVRASKTQEQPKLEAQVNDAVEKHADIAGEDSELKKDQNGDPPPSDVALSLLESQEVTTTDALDSADVLLETDQPSGTSSPSVNFRQDANLQPSFAQLPPEATEEDQASNETVSNDAEPNDAEPNRTVLNYTGDTIGQRNDTVVLKAELSEIDEPVGDLGGNEVVFTVTDGISTQVATATTDSRGTAQVSAPVSLSAGLYDINATFAGDSYYLGSSSKASLVVWDAIAGLNISGRGRLTDDHEKVNFRFSAKYTKNSDVPLGQLELVDRSGESELDIRTEGFNWLVVTSDNFALLQGSVSLNGASGYSFEMLVSDNGTPGKGKDFLELSIYGIPVVSGFIDSGNIVVH